MAASSRVFSVEGVLGCGHGVAAVCQLRLELLLWVGQLGVLHGVLEFPGD